MKRSFAAETRPRAASVNEHEVRAAAGLTMVTGAVAFSYAYFAKQYVPLRVAASLFFAEFLIRVTVGLRYSPVGVVARAMTLGRAPEWVSAKPKRFAWTLGLVMALAMTIITNSGIRGPLPRTMCLICLTLMWMESALGLCLGCKIYGLLLRRGWIGANSDVQVCADGSCERQLMPATNAATRVSSASGGLSVTLVVGALLLSASGAAAAPGPSGAPARFWSVSKVELAVGNVLFTSGAQVGGALDKTVDLVTFAVIGSVGGAAVMSSLAPGPPTVSHSRLRATRSATSRLRSYSGEPELRRSSRVAPAPERAALRFIRDLQRWAQNRLGTIPAVDASPRIVRLITRRGRSAAVTTSHVLPLMRMASAGPAEYVATSVMGNFLVGRRGPHWLVVSLPGD
jgi:hypothetical protein